MAPLPVVRLPGAGAPLAVGKERFTQVFQETAPARVRPSTPTAGAALPSGCGARSTHPPLQPLPPKAVDALDRVRAAEARLDHLFALARSGRSFTPAELLAIQAQVATASQQLELASHVVDKATSGVKQVLQTQV